MMARTAIHPLKLLAAVGTAFVLWGLVLASPAYATTYTVNSTADSTDSDGCTPDPGGCTLREAIDAANASSGVADTIDFDLGPEATITRSSQLFQLRVSDPHELTIDGGSADITVSGDNAVQVFIVGSGAKLTLSNLTVANGRAGLVGGGIENQGTLTVNNSTFSGNTSRGITFGGGSGGGIFNSGTLTVNNSTFSKNSAANPSLLDYGGGIVNFGTATVTNSTFSENSSDYGGGIGNLSVGTLEVTNSTFSKNSALLDGGGIFNQGLPTLTLTVTNSTFSDNSARDGGGIWNSGAATFKNTIVANSPSGGNCVGTITDGGGNLDDGATCGFTNPTSKSDTLAGLDPAGLANNGGPTETIALCSGAGTPANCTGPSAAIDAAVECPPPATDQRGVSRPQGAACDIGAFELESSTPIPKTKAECKKGGWRNFSFPDQGTCISFVNRRNR